MHELIFDSALRVERPALWASITSVEGIRMEMKPLLRMTSPAGITSLADLPFEPGKTLFRSTLLLAGVLPIDVSWLSLQAVTHNLGFVERSRMLSMSTWEHRREILDNPNEPGTVILRDQLRFAPRLPAPLVTWFVRCLFKHRHARLRHAFGVADQSTPNR